MKIVIPKCNFLISYLLDFLMMFSFKVSTKINTTKKQEYFYLKFRRKLLKN